jgi:transcriptional regulator with XRE-family HTH domain
VSTHFAKFIVISFKFAFCKVKYINKEVLWGNIMFGKRLRALRKENNLTMKQLGDKLSLAESTISGYENSNRKPDMDILRRFADFFDVSTDYLLGRTNNLGSGFSDEDMMDPELDLLFKEIKEDSPERREQLLKIWRIIKNEDNTK